MNLDHEGTTSMKKPAVKQRNLVHLAMLQTRRGGAHDKTNKQRRANEKTRWRKNVRHNDEGGFFQPAVLVA